MIHPKILLKGVFNAENITFKFNENSTRKIVPELESKIPELWEEVYNTAKEKGQLVFNGESFRLDNFKVENNKLTIEVSKFRYSVRSALTKQAEELLKHGEEYTSKGLAVAGFLKTSDDKFIFGQRSGKTISNNTIDFIGGILEPDNIQTGNELFQWNKKEVKEEINIDEASFNKMIALGMVFSTSTNVIIITYSELKLNSKEIYENFKMNHDIEMSDLIFKELKELPNYLPTLGNYKSVVYELLEQIL